MAEETAQKEPSVSPAQSKAGEISGASGAGTIAVHMQADAGGQYTFVRRFRRLPNTAPGRE